MPPATSEGPSRTFASARTNPSGRAVDVLLNVGGETSLRPLDCRLHLLGTGSVEAGLLCGEPDPAELVAVRIREIVTLANFLLVRIPVLPGDKYARGLEAAFPVRRDPEVDRRSPVVSLLRGAVDELQGD